MKNIFASSIEIERAVLTAMLIREVFSIKNTGMRIYKSEMRYQELNKEINKLYDNLEELDKHPDSKVNIEQEEQQ